MRHRKSPVATGAALAVAASGMVTGSFAQETATHNGEKQCAEAVPIGRFDPATDFYIANFDIKTDVDDLHSVAALATMLAAPRYGCVDYVAVHGAYGEQGGDFIPAAGLFDLAFDGNWLDAHGARAETVAALGNHIVGTLAAGGDVWIQEAGQSDISAAAVRMAQTVAPGLDYAARVHLVQHSDWNEQSTTDADLAFVQATVDYIRIPDGNGVGNGSPGFKTSEGGAWEALTSDPDTGPVWTAARRLADQENPEPGYVNDAVAAGGLDFSDTAEATYIFGHEDMLDTNDFVRIFVTGR